MPLLRPRLLVLGSIRRTQVVFNGIQILEEAVGPLAWVLPWAVGICMSRALFPFVKDRNIRTGSLLTNLLKRNSRALRCRRVRARGGPRCCLVAKPDQTSAASPKRHRHWACKQTTHLAFGMLKLCYDAMNFNGVELCEQDRLLTMSSI